MTESTLRFWEATGTGAMSETFSYVPARTVHVERISLHLSSKGAVQENFTVTQDSALGSQHDVRLLKLNTANRADYVSDQRQKFSLPKEDSLVFAWPNAGGKTWGLEVAYRLEL